MMESMIKAAVASEFTRIFKKCINRYAQALKTTYDKVFILLVYEPSGKEDVANVGYRLVVNKDTGLVIERSLSILEILDVRHFHMRGYDKMAPPYIEKSLLNLAESNQMDPLCTSVLVCTANTDVFLFLYNFDKEKGHLVGSSIKQLDDIEQLF